LELPEKFVKAATIFTTDPEKAEKLVMSKEWAIARTIETLEGELYILVKLQKQKEEVF